MAWMLIVLAGYGNLQFNHLYYDSYDLCNYHGSVIEDRSTIFIKYKTECKYTKVDYSQNVIGRR
jgi:hypothetical protein